MLRSTIVALTTVLALSACRPDFGARESRVTSERVLAMKSEPAEARAGDSVTYTLLVARPEGTDSAPAAAWSYCTEPVLLTENTSIPASCASGDARAVIDANGESAHASLPANACSVYGPEVPPGSGLRPHDPDATGGYYQPVRAGLASGAAFGFTRLTCAVTNASADVTAELAKRYVVNSNPRLLPPTGDVNGARVDLAHVPRGARVHLVAGWGEGTEGAEAYVVLDVGSQTVVARREAMRVSWFATDGVYDEDRTGRTEDDVAATTDNVWTAPDHAGVVHAWVVLRDSRGGTDFASFDLVVE